MGARLRGGLDELVAAHPEQLAERRGLGLMQALETRSDALGFELTKQCFGHGLLAIFAFNQQSTLQIMPPLIISAEEVDEVLERLDGGGGDGCLRRLRYSDLGASTLRPLSVAGRDPVGSPRRCACGVRADAVGSATRGAMDMLQSDVTVTQEDLDRRGSRRPAGCRRTPGPSARWCCARREARRRRAAAADRGPLDDVSYPTLARSARDIARGLIALGIEPGDHVSILANTRPEWTVADMARLLRRRRRGADLPHQLTRGVPVRPRPLRRARGVLRGRRAAREGPGACATRVPRCAR